MTGVKSERVYPVLSRVCIGVGIAFLLVSAFGNWRFGWSLSNDPIDRWWLAIIYAGSDVAAGVLVATGATMLRHPGWRWKLGGCVALVPATILVALSVLSTFGMMSGRIATLAGQQAALSVDEGRLKWLRGQTLNQDIPRSERRAFRVEEREAAREARKAASVVTDHQAVAIAQAAAVVGIKLTTEQTQVGLTFVSSTMPMTIKFVCIGLGFFLFGARVGESDAANQKTQAGSDGSSGGSGPEPTKPRLVHPEPEKPVAARTKEAPAPKRAEPGKVRRVHESVISTDAQKGKLTYEQFVNLLRQEMAHGDLAVSTRALARQTGWSQTSVVRQARRLKEQAKPRIRRYTGGGGGLHSLALG